MVPLNNITFQTPDIIDYIPFANTAYNIAILCIKLFDAISPQEKDKSSEFYRYACAKDLTRTFIGAIPIIGNIFLGIFDASSPKDPPPIDPQPIKNEEGAKNDISRDIENLPINPIIETEEVKREREDARKLEQLLELAHSNFNKFTNHPDVKGKSLNLDLEFVKSFVKINGGAHYDWIHEDLQNHRDVVSQLLHQDNLDKISDIEVQKKLLETLGEEGEIHLLTLFKKTNCKWTLSSLPGKVHINFDFVDFAIENGRLGEPLQQSKEFADFLLAYDRKIR